MKTPNSTAMPASAEPKLGVDICDCCGRPPTVVGPLIAEGGDLDGYCRFCARETQLYDILADELTAVVADWVQACRDRKVSDHHIEEAFEVAQERALKRTPEAAQA